MISTEHLNSLNQSVTMSSREIARMIGISHGEVKRLIKSLETAQRLSQPVTVSLYEREGEMRQEYWLNKRDSLLAVARLSPGFTAELLDNWQEREKTAHLPDFTNPAAAARAWAEQFEQRQAAETSNLRSQAQRPNSLTVSFRLKTRWGFASCARC